MRGALDRPALAGGIALALVISLFAVTFVVSDPENASLYRDDVLGYSLTIPPGWQQLHPVATPDMAEALAPVFRENVLFGNPAAAVMDDQPFSTHEALLHVPEGGVLVWVSPAEPYLSVYDLTTNDSDYPPAPALGTSIFGDPNDHDASVFRAEGLRFIVSAVYGEHVSGADQDAARAISTSIEVAAAAPAPPEGSAVVRFPMQPDVRSWRIGPVDRFPPGSVVQLSVEPTPGVHQPHHLFIVTPTHAAGSYARWMVTDLDGPCADLSWGGSVFRCRHRTWEPSGAPTDPAPHAHPLITSSVVQTWDGQLITADNGIVEFLPQDAATIVI